MRFTSIARLALMAGIGLLVAVSSPASAARNDQGAGARSQLSRQAPRAAAAPRAAVARAAAPRATAPRGTSRSVTAARGPQASPLLRRVATTSSNMRAQPAMLRGSANAATVRGQAARQQANSCSTVRGRRVCTGNRQVALRWSNGIAPAGGQQSSCPDGTMAMLALGHDNVYRCVPL
ncbi:hypothetical protein [Rhodovarius lipocyclicus]|uniref:hypothetical protein n=1 Tax=Rhodovarius lipocyclicus TaxID=268410 RepID=UPI00135C78FA|nr:hypothetical protein [Rhodovarius lipocyclicus]